MLFLQVILNGTLQLNQYTFVKSFATDIKEGFL